MLPASLVQKLSNIPFRSKDLLNPVSQCKGFTYISEDSSEITFLLVENYQLTAPIGLRIGREFLDTIHHVVIPFHQFGFASPRSPGEENSRRAWQSIRLLLRRLYGLSTIWVQEGQYVVCYVKVCLHQRRGSPRRQAACAITRLERYCTSKALHYLILSFCCLNIRYEHTLIAYCFTGSFTAGPVDK